MEPGVVVIDVEETGDFPSKHFVLLIAAYHHDANDNIVSIFRRFMARPSTSHCFSTEDEMFQRPYFPALCKRWTVYANDPYESMHDFCAWLNDVILHDPNIEVLVRSAKTREWIDRYLYAFTFHSPLHLFTESETAWPVIVPLSETESNMEMDERMCLVSVRHRAKNEGPPNHVLQ